jgi:hypothetical protein
MHFLPMRRFWLLMRPTLKVLDDEDAQQILHLLLTHGRGGGLPSHGIGRNLRTHRPVIQGLIAELNSVTSAMRVLHRYALAMKKSV